jgi:hypothetical protein
VGGGLVGVRDDRRDWLLGREWTTIQRVGYSSRIAYVVLCNNASTRVDGCVCTHVA